MKVAISQPEHFPYLGYFQKMMCCDLFILLDNVQFSGPRSFQNRNRFTTNNEQQWFTVPVENGSYFKLIKDVKTAPDFGWRRKIIKTLNQHFSGIDYEKIYSHDMLVDINIDGIEVCRNYLDISTPMIRSSSLDIHGHKENLIYSLCKQVGADTYISGQGAKVYMEGKKFDGIDIKFINPIVNTMDTSISLISKPNRLLETQMNCKKFMEIFNHG